MKIARIENTLVYLVGSVDLAYANAYINNTGNLRTMCLISLTKHHLIYEIYLYVHYIVQYLVFEL